MLGARAGLQRSVQYSSAAASGSVQLGLRGQSSRNDVRGMLRVVAGK